MASAIAPAFLVLTADAQTSGSQSITIGIVGTPSDPFNPVTQIALIDHWIQYILYMTPIAYAPNGTIIPWLVQSYNVSPDGKTYTFVLRHNAVWSDGQPITVRDFVFTLKAYIEQSTRVTSLLPFAEKASGTFSGYTLNSSTVQTPNNYTLILHPTTVAPSLTAYFASFFFVLPEHVDQGQNLTTNTYINSHLVTDGPWYLAKPSDYVPGSYMTLTANPNFSLGAPKIKTLTLQFFQTATAAEEALRSGTIQMMAQVPFSDAASIKQAGFTTFTAPLMRVFFLQFNLNKYLSTGSYNPLSDYRVREALCYATNVTALVNSVSQGYFKVWNQAEPYGMTYLGYPAYNSSLPNPMCPYNPAKAKSLLSQAGVSNMTISLYTLATIPYFVSATEILKSEWAQVGVTLDVHLEQTSQWVSDTFNTHPKAWNINLYDLTEPQDPFYPVNFLFGPGTGNAGNYTNPMIQNLIYNVSNHAPSPQARAAVFQEIDYLANKDLPYLFLASETEVDAWSPNIQFTDGIGGMMNLPSALYALSYSSPSSISSTSTTPSNSTSTAPPSGGYSVYLITVVAVVVIVLIAIVALALRRRGPKT